MVPPRSRVLPAVLVQQRVSSSGSLPRRSEREGWCSVRLSRIETSPAGEEEVVSSRFWSLEEIFVKILKLMTGASVLIGQIQKNPEVQIKPCDRDVYIFLFWMLEQLLLFKPIIHGSISLPAR